MNINKQQRWRNHLAAAQEFSGSVDSYCRAKGIRPSAFYYWKKKLGAMRTMVPVIPSFVPVEVVSEPHHPGNRLPDPKWLAEFILHVSRGIR